MKTSRATKPSRYVQLLVQARPSVIETERENERLLARVETLMSKGEDLSPEELKLLKLMVLLIEDYEARRYPLRRSTPHEALRELMKVRGIRQRDLWGVVGSKGVTSEIVNGKRSISKSQAKALAEFFHVSADLFI